MARDRNSADQPYAFDDERLSAYLDGELSAPETAQLEARLVVDAELRKLVDELRALRPRLEMLPEYKLDSGFAERVLARLARENAANTADATTVSTPYLPTTIAAVSYSRNADEPVVPVARKAEQNGSRRRTALIWTLVGTAAAVLLMLTQPGEQAQVTINTVGDQKPEAAGKPTTAGVKENSAEFSSRTGEVADKLKASEIEKQNEAHDRAELKLAGQLPQGGSAAAVPGAANPDANSAIGEAGKFYGSQPQAAARKALPELKQSDKAEFEQSADEAKTTIAGGAGLSTGNSPTEPAAPRAAMPRMPTADDDYSFKANSVPSAVTLSETDTTTSTLPMVLYLEVAPQRSTTAIEELRSLLVSKTGRIATATHEELALLREFTNEHNPRERREDQLREPSQRDEAKPVGQEAYELAGAQQQAGKPNPESAAAAEKQLPQPSAQSHSAQSGSPKQAQRSLLGDQHANLKHEQFRRESASAGVLVYLIDGEADEVDQLISRLNRTWSDKASDVKADKHQQPSKDESLSNAPDNAVTKSTIDGKSRVGSLRAVQINPVQLPSTLLASEMSKQPQATDAAAEPFKGQQAHAGNADSQSWFGGAKVGKAELNEKSKAVAPNEVLGGQMPPAPLVEGSSEKSAKAELADATMSRVKGGKKSERINKSKSVDRNAEESDPHSANGAILRGATPGATASAAQNGSVTSPAAQPAAEFAKPNQPLATSLSQGGGQPAVNRRRVLLIVRTLPVETTAPALIAPTQPAQSQPAIPTAPQP